MFKLGTHKTNVRTVLVTAGVLTLLSSMFMLMPELVSFSQINKEEGVTLEQAQGLATSKSLKEATTTLLTFLIAAALMAATAFLKSRNNLFAQKAKQGFAGTTNILQNYIATLPPIRGPSLA